MNEASSKISTHTVPVKVSPSDIARFWESVPNRPQNGCWLWIGCKNETGYGLINISRRARLAHRVSKIIELGDIPMGFCITHDCDTPACVRPDHLKVSTKKKNSAEMVERKRSTKGEKHHSFTHPEIIPKGEKHWFAKLTGPKATEIRKRYASGELASALAIAFGVALTTVWAVIYRRTWKHVP